MQKIINLTPHDITLLDKDGNVVESFHKSGMIIRLQSDTKKIAEVDLNGIKIPVTKTIFGSSTLPKREEGTIYLVSAVTAQAFPDRDDLYFPNEIVRDKNGSILGCKSFGKL